MAILNFLCMHPFSDGNGRMARLLTLLLLCQAGYIVGKYISIEKIIGQTKETYYEMLRQSPDVSEVTVQRTLAELLKNGDIIKIGGGRYTHYVWNREKDE
ncbi:MAG: hypothetical protein HDR33_04475 [Treponema sp.]|nr:hypothetical protein [Treponema sp.]